MREDEVREALRSIQQTQRETRQEIDDLASSLARLVKELEQENRIRERGDRADEKEADQRYGDLRDRVEAIGVAMRDLPRLVFQAVEREIYVLRTARYEALKAGVSNEPAPLPFLPSAQEASGPIAVAVPVAVAPRSDQTAPYALHHRDGEKREVKEIVGGAVMWVTVRTWKWVAASTVGGGLVHLLHKLGLF